MESIKDEIFNYLVEIGEGWYEERRMSVYRKEIGAYRYIYVHLTDPIFMKFVNKKDQSVSEPITVNSLDQFKSLIRLFSGDSTKITKGWLVNGGYKDRTGEIDLRKRVNNASVFVKILSSPMSDTLIEAMVIIGESIRTRAIYKEMHPMETLFMNEDYVDTAEDLELFLKECDQKKSTLVTKEYLEASDFSNMAYNRASGSSTEFYQSTERFDMDGRYFTEQVIIEIDIGGMGLVPGKEIDHVLCRYKISSTDLGLEGTDEQYVSTVIDLRLFIAKCKEAHRKKVREFLLYQKKDDLVYENLTSGSIYINAIAQDDLGKKLEELGKKISEMIHDGMMVDFIHGHSTDKITDFERIRPGEIRQRMEQIQKSGMGRNSWSGKKSWREQSGRNSSLGLTPPDDG